MSISESLRTSDHFLQCLSTVPAGPKWSFKGRHPTIFKNIFPGPGAYEVKNNPASTNPPKFGFGSEQRGRTKQKGSSPAPGSYNPKNVTTRKSPEWSFTGRHSNASLVNSPGPGAYDSCLKDPIFEQKGKGFSFGLSERKKITKDNPGPGAYNPQFVTLQSTPTWIIGTANRSTLYSVKANVPGPGAYYNPNTFQEGVKYSFAGKNEGKTIQTSPGPGEYSPLKQKSEKYNWSFGIKTKSRSSVISSPGPGSYFNNNSGIMASKRQTQCIFGTEPRISKSLPNFPGPGFYNPVSASLRRAPAWGFGTTTGSSCDVKERDGPGPGMYALLTKIDEGSKYSWGHASRGTNDHNEKEDKPGPGSYSPSSIFRCKSTPVWIFGTAKRLANNLKEESPGPGLYDPLNRSSSPRWTMGSKTNSENVGNSQISTKSARVDSGKVPAIYTCFGY